jgi:phosphopantothenoylcysteine decarboxylase/phosphopantothenate--cysteine ligase
MNTVMWEKPQVQGNLKLLQERGARTIGPVGGNLACGENGLGAMSDPTAIAAAIA